MGASFFSVYPEAQVTLDQIEQAIADKTPQSRANLSITRMSDERVFNIAVYPLIDSDVDGAVIRMDDVTEQTRIQEMVIQSEKMASIGALAAGMAHELSNPLAGVLNNIEMVKHRMDPKDRQNIETAAECGTSLVDVASYLDKSNMTAMFDAIDGSAERASNIIKNALGFSRKSNGVYARRQVSDLIESTLELITNKYNIEQQIDFKIIEIVRKFEPDIPALECDPGKLQQVFLNIIKNAAQSFDPDAAVAVSPRITIEIRSLKKKVQISIADNGVGMTEETRKRIFEPFFTTKTPGEGTGLGLSVSYLIVTENHNGEIRVESTLGRGTKFTTD
jgi:signal transduction histidine kinase